MKSTKNEQMKISVTDIAKFDRGLREFYINKRTNFTSVNHLASAN